MRLLHLRNLDERGRVAGPDLADGDDRTRDDEDPEQRRCGPEAGTSVGDAMGVCRRSMLLGVASTRRGGSRHDMLSAITTGPTSTWLYGCAPTRYLSTNANCVIEPATVEGVLPAA